MKPNGHMIPAAVPFVQQAMTVPNTWLQYMGLIQTMGRGRLLLLVAPTVRSAGRLPPNLVPPTTKEDGEIDLSCPSLETPFPRRGWEEALKQPHAFKMTRWRTLLIGLYPRGERTPRFIVQNCRLLRGKHRNKSW